MAARGAGQCVLPIKKLVLVSGPSECSKSQARAEAQVSASNPEVHCHWLNLLNTISVSSTDSAICLLGNPCL